MAVDTNCNAKSQTGTVGTDSPNDSDGYNRGESPAIHQNHTDSLLIVTWSLARRQLEPEMVAFPGIARIHRPYLPCCCHSCFLEDDFFRRAFTALAGQGHTWRRRQMETAVKMMGMKVRPCGPPLMLSKILKKLDCTCLGSSAR